MIHYEKNGVIVRDSVESDIALLAPRLREEDSKEVIAAGNVSNEAALTQSFTRSTLRYSLERQGVVVAMLGIVPDAEVAGSGNIWLLGAPEVAEMKKTFVKLSRRFIRQFLVEYNTLWNMVDGRYNSSIQWLKSCGAIFIHKPVKLSGVDFYLFTIKGA